MFYLYVIDYILDVDSFNFLIAYICWSSYMYSQTFLSLQINAQMQSFIKYRCKVKCQGPVSQRILRQIVDVSSC